MHCIGDGYESWLRSKFDINVFCATINALKGVFWDIVALCTLKNTHLPPNGRILV